MYSEGPVPLSPSSNGSLGETCFLNVDSLKKSVLSRHGTSALYMKQVRWIRSICSVINVFMSLWLGHSVVILVILVIPCNVTAPAPCCPWPLAPALCPRTPLNQGEPHPALLATTATNTKHSTAKHSKTQAKRSKTKQTQGAGCTWPRSRLRRTLF